MPRRAQALRGILVQREASSREDESRPGGQGLVLVLGVLQDSLDPPRGGVQGRLPCCDSLGEDFVQHVADAAHPAIELGYIALRLMDERKRQRAAPVHHVVRRIQDATLGERISVHIRFELVIG